MGEKLDEIKGRTKEAAGDLTDNDELKREGKVDRAAGKAKGVAENAGEKAKEGVERAREAVNESMRRD